MRLVKRNINRDGSGSVVLCPEEPEDMVSLPFVQICHVVHCADEMPLIVACL